MDETTTGKKDFLQKNSPSDKHWLREIVELIVLSLLIVAPIRLFIVNPFVVSGSSMVPTFHNGEYLIVDQISYRFDEPKRGDVIIFHYPKDETKFFIKRIIGIPGETVNLKQGSITIERKEGEPLVLEESYVKNKSLDSGKYTLGNGEYFVMGDNRISSSDSRVWGKLDRDLIVGRALLRLLPVTEISIFPGKQENYAPQN